MRELIECPACSSPIEISSEDQYMSRGLFMKCWCGVKFWVSPLVSVNGEYLRRVMKDRFAEHITLKEET